MNSDQYFLCKIAEECTEIAHRALKAQQFGLGEIQPNQTLSNFERLVSEYHDLHTTFMAFMCQVGNHDGMYPSQQAMETRLNKTRKFLTLSKELGQVDHETEI
ncbi:MAG: hypothetical protein ABJO86_00820 [Lentilitoribacter sp.]